MPLILPSNSISDLGYEVDNSLRFNDGSSDNLSKSTGTPSSRQKFTFSTWIKLSSVSGNRSIFNIEIDGNTTLFFMVKNGDQLHFVDYNSGAEQAKLTTNALYRDPSAWYHVVLRLDSTQGTNINRCRLYVNGSEVTSFSATVYPSQNYNFTNNVGNTRIGVSQGNANYWDGYMAETVYCDGQSLDADSFGEFDSDSGIWKPKAVSGLTFGTNGFYLDFENSGSLGADVSGNGNNFTVNNLTSIDQTTDTPTNNFCTLNPLITPATMTFTNGNLGLSGYTAFTSAYGTFGLSSGKWYWELIAQNNAMAGVSATLNGSQYPGQASDSYAFDFINGDKYNNGTVATFGSGAVSVGDTVGVAFDADNGDLKFYNNSGSLIGTAYTGLTSFPYLPVFRNGDSVNISINFGNPPYTESGGNSDANGYGNFKHSVPSGFYALNTKNLAEYG